MELTKDQEYVFNEVMDKLGAPKNRTPVYYPNFKYITIGGYAGTGKTFLISILRNEIYKIFRNRNIAFVTFTGKASSVLKGKLEDNNAIFSGDFIGTIHSLIYVPELKYDKNTHRMIITKWVKKPELQYDLIFVDEASMVNKQIWFDLLNYKIPIIAVGDHGQLPPVGDQFNLMENLNYVLTEIKRQALDNPIIRLSQDIRNGKEIPYGFYDQNNKSVFKLSWKSEECKKIFNNLDFTSEEMIVLCGMNKTRVSINQMIRNKLGFINPEPYPSEKIIFLKNNYTSKVMNGMLGKNLFLLYEDKDVYNMTVSLDGINEPYSGLVYNGCFGKEQYDLDYEKLQILTKKLKNKNKIPRNKIDKTADTIDICDFGHTISVHKAQGSSKRKVVLFQEKSYFWNEEFMRRWLYTGVTRAEEKLFIITP